MNTTLLELRLNRKWLLIMPLSIYLSSYVYLAIYHATPWLFNIPVHESGEYTLLETMLYASHFIGHIPVLLILAIIFLGTHYMFSGSRNAQQQRYLQWFFFLVIFLVISGILSLHLFGWQDTMLFLKQKKQSQVISVPGGSWLLHLPSTVMFLIFMPLYFFIMHFFFGQPIRLTRKGEGWIGVAIAGIVLMTWISTRSWNFFGILYAVWTSPRYLAHSVRELMTFPFTMFPLPFYFLFVSETQPERCLPKIAKWSLLALGILFFAFFAYQCILPLAHGIGDLAQKPIFAHEGRLSIAYLLASHSFEHFLDSIFFLLVVMVLYECRDFFMKKKDCQ